jgi:hypothetical protein
LMGWACCGVEKRKEKWIVRASGSSRFDNQHTATTTHHLLHSPMRSCWFLLLHVGWLAGWLLGVGVRPREVC